MFSELVIIIILFGHVSTGPGTTPNIRQIVIGRCYEYITLINPSYRYKCEEIWNEFEEAVVQRTPCSVRVKDYERMFNAVPQTPPCDKLIAPLSLCCDLVILAHGHHVYCENSYTGVQMLLWSKTRELMQSYLTVSGSFWTLEDTLVGFMFNDLIWCGQQEKDRGFDFYSCPEWATCLSHPVYSLWKSASQNFAAAACGNITVLLNGSIENAFNKNSMFGSVELDSLNPRMVSHVHIKVVPNLKGPFVESCSKGSIPRLIGVLQNRGFHWSCTDSDVYLDQQPTP